MTEPFIRCSGLVKIYKAADLEVVALQGLDLTVTRGEVMAIIGNSGSGKSTLLNILGALDLPSAGRAQVGEWDLLRLTPRQRIRYQRETVGFVWQSSGVHLLPYLSALENVMLPMELAGVGRRRRQSRALELLEAVGLGDRVHHRPAMLSGGQQQRVGIAMALANQPDLLLADEPTGSVDSATAGAILQIFREINQRYGTTIVIVTHDRSLARAVDRYVLIRDGKVSQESVRRRVGAAAGNPAAANGAAHLGDRAGSPGGNSPGKSAGDQKGGPAQGPPGTGEAGLPAAAAGEGPDGETTHEEWVVLDSAGRLQVPPEYLQALGIRERARLELEEGRVVIKPPGDAG